MEPNFGISCVQDQWPGWTRHHSPDEADAAWLNTFVVALPVSGVSLLSEAATNSIWSIVSDCEIYPFLCLPFICLALVYTTDTIIRKLSLMLCQSFSKTSVRLTNVMTVVDAGDEKMSKVLFSIVLPSIQVSQMSSW